MMDSIMEIWPILFSILGFIIWLARLEGKVRANERRIRLVESSAPNMIKLANDLAEIKTDIKWIKQALPSNEE